MNPLLLPRASATARARQGGWDARRGGTVLIMLKTTYKNGGGTGAPSAGACNVAYATLNKVD